MPLVSVVPLTVEPALIRVVDMVVQPAPSDRDRITRRMLDRFKNLDKLHASHDNDAPHDHEPKMTPPCFDSNAWFRSSVNKIVRRGCLMNEDASADALLSRLMNDPLIVLRTPPKPKPKPPTSLPAKAKRVQSRSPGASSSPTKHNRSPMSTYLRRWQGDQHSKSPRVGCRWASRRTKETTINVAHATGDALDEWIGGTVGHGASAKAADNKSRCSEELCRTSEERSALPTRLVCNEGTGSDALDAFMSLAQAR